MAKEGKWVDVRHPVEWGTKDFAGIRGTRIHVDVGRERYDAIYRELLEGMIAYSQGELYLILDYHVQDPYHGPPPHYNQKGRHSAPHGFGYTPFGWGEGWLWMEDRITQLVERWQPEIVQQAQDPHIRNWTDPETGEPDPQWPWGDRMDLAYADTMTIYENGLNDAAYGGLFVVAKSPFDRAVYNRAAKEKFGERRRMELDFEFINFEDLAPVDSVPEDPLWPDEPVPAIIGPATTPKGQGPRVVRKRIEKNQHIIIDVLNSLVMMLGEDDE